MMGDSFFISIVTPTYNRKDTIKRCVDSAILFCKTANIVQASEMIVVDDVSKDDTVLFLNLSYPDLIKCGWLKIIKQPINKGFLSSRNIGVKKAKGKWVLFLDSDDEIISGSAMAFLKILEKSTIPFIYFRCIDGDSKKLLGPDIPECVISYNEYINKGTVAEALPVIKRDLILRFPYDEDMRASAGLAYARMTKECQEIFWTNLPARIYYQNRDDRLTLKRFERASFFLRGYKRFLFENFFSLKWKKKSDLFLKIIFYSLVVFFQRIKIL